MTVMEPVAVAVADEQPNYIQWAPAIAGALAAAALAFVLHSFAAAIGLAVSSTAPTWRDASLALQLLSGLYLVFVAIVAFGVGGYIAGRMRTPIAASDDEVEFRDGTHGLLVWAIAMVITVLMTSAAAQSLTRLAAPRAGRPARAIGRRRERHRVRSRPSVPRREAAAERRPELCAVGSRAHPAHHRKPPRHQSDDRAYLVRLTAANTGLARAGSREARRHHHHAGARQYPQGPARGRDPRLHGRRGGAARRGGRVVRGRRRRPRARWRLAASMTWGWNGPRMMR